MLIASTPEPFNLVHAFHYARSSAAVHDQVWTTSRLAFQKLSVARGCSEAWPRQMALGPWGGNYLESVCRSVGGRGGKTWVFVWCSRQREWAVPVAPSRPGTVGVIIEPPEMLPREEAARPPVDWDEC
jgi:hypothetical protein